MVKKKWHKAATDSLAIVLPMLLYFFQY